MVRHAWTVIDDDGAARGLPPEQPPGIRDDHRLSPRDCRGRDDGDAKREQPEIRGRRRAECGRPEPRDESQRRKWKRRRTLAPEEMNQYRPADRGQREQCGRIDPLDAHRDRPARALQEIRAKSRVERLIGRHARVVDAEPGAARAPAFEKVIHPPRIGLADRTGVGPHSPSGLQIFHLDLALEREFELFSSEDLEHRDFVPHADGSAQLRFGRPVVIVVKIGQHDQQTAPFEQLSGPAQRGPRRRWLRTARRATAPRSSSRRCACPRRLPTNCLTPSS